MALDCDVDPLVQIPVQNSALEQATKTRTSRGRSRRKPAKIVRLYRQKPPDPTEAEIHLQHLLKILADACDDFPELRRHWIPKADLEKFYAEIAEQKGWQTQSWTAMGKALAKAANRRRTKIRGKHMTCYCLPTPAKSATTQQRHPTSQVQGS